MRKKDKDGFMIVSAFSKTPLQNRFRTLLVIYFLIATLEVANFHYISGISIIIVSMIIIVISVLITIIFAKLKVEFNRSPFLSLQRYIHDNRLYEDEIRQIGFDRDGNPKQKKVIFNSAYFSYKETENDLIVRSWKRADKFSDKANSQDTMLSALFGKELYRKQDNVQFCDYIFELVKDKRLSMNTRKPSKGMIIQMTEKISWSLGKPPHTLIVGSTNSGKTYLVSMLILDYLYMGADLFIADPKSADLAMIGRIIDVKRYSKITNTATSENEIAGLFRRANEEMEKRFKEWFSDESAFGKTWRDIPTAKPLVFVFDEYSAFISVASPKIVKEVNGYLFNLILKGRQAGIEVVMILQRPDANILSANIRDQFGVRIGLSNMTNDGRKMLFGSVDMEYKNIQEIGSGYLLIDGVFDKPVYFETPLMSHGMDYLDELNKAIEENKPKTITPLKVV